MKFVHVMVREKFTNGVVAFLNKFFNNGEHEILFYHVGQDDTLINSTYTIPQSEIYAKEGDDLVSCLRKINCDYIFLHSLFFLSTLNKIKLIKARNIMNKLIWVEWGADLYSWKNNGNGIKNIIVNYVNYIFRKKFSNVICIFPPDVDYFRREFTKSNAKLYYAPYTLYPIAKELQEKYDRQSELELDLKGNKTIYIQIGHNGMKTLNHKRVLDYLSAYRKENIHILLPLSYGCDKEYVDEIERYAKGIYADKVTVLRDFMPKDQYYELIKKISIAIFDTDRQCALANLHIMNFNNVKLFLSESGVMYDYFVDQGISVGKCEDICNMTYKEFVKPVHTRNEKKFMQYIYDISHTESGAKKWKEIFDKLKEKLG